ncbi:MAG: hypothetical protein JST81_15690 [Bacteroidetes bacterium]|nr:hypothetical protein [Bacteroidota bacterium]
MKKGIFTFVFFFLFSTLFISCSKSDIHEALMDDSTGQIDYSELSDKGHHFGGHHGEHHGGNGGGHHHNNDCCCDQCPSSVATATGISYYLNLWEPQHVLVDIDISYENPGPAGSLRIVSTNVNNAIDSVIVVPAQQTVSGQTAIVHIQLDVADTEFPIHLDITGLPSNTDCDIRSHAGFDIVNNVSRK